MTILLGKFVSAGTAQCRRAPPGTGQASTSVCSRPTRPESSCASSTQPAGSSSNASSFPNSPTRSGTATSKDLRPGHGLRLPRSRTVSAGSRTPLQPAQTAARSVRARAHRLARVERRLLRLHHRRRRAATCRSTRGTARPSCRSRSSSIRAFEWRGEPRRPSVPWDETILYELHVGGYTRQRFDLPEPQRGTFAGLGCRRSSTTSSLSASPASS